MMVWTAPSACPFAVCVLGLMSYAWISMLLQSCWIVCLHTVDQWPWLQCLVYHVSQTWISGLQLHSEQLCQTFGWLLEIWSINQQTVSNLNHCNRSVPVFDQGLSGIGCDISGTLGLMFLCVLQTGQWETNSSVWVDMFRQYRTSLALYLHFTTPRCDSWIFISISCLNSLGTISFPDFNKSFDVKLISSLNVQHFFH